jgi:hypothetical protein
MSARTSGISWVTESNIRSYCEGRV